MLFVRGIDINNRVSNFLLVSLQIRWLNSTCDGDNGDDVNDDVSDDGDHGHNGNTRKLGQVRKIGLTYKVYHTIETMHSLYLLGNPPTSQISSLFANASCSLVLSFI